MALHENWFDYEEQVLVPFISNGPLIFWLYASFGIRGATRELLDGGMLRHYVEQLSVTGLMRSGTAPAMTGTSPGERWRPDRQRICSSNWPCGSDPGRAVVPARLRADRRRGRLGVPRGLATSGP
jgi:hypothetical protein